MYNLDNPILKGLWKFQVDIPKNARFRAVQGLESLHTVHL